VAFVCCRHVGGKVWVSLKHPHQTTIHGTLKTEDLSAEGRLSVATSEGFELNLLDRRTISISHIETGVSTKFVAPVATYYNIHKKSVSSWFVFYWKNWCIAFSYSHRNFCKIFCKISEILCWRSIPWL